MNIVGLQRLGESCTVGTGALHAGGQNLAETAGPADPGPIAGGVGAELGIAEQLTSVGDGR